MLIDKNDTVVVEDPTFLGALIAFSSCQPHYVTVSMDEEGMDVAPRDERSTKCAARAPSRFSRAEAEISIVG